MTNYSGTLIDDDGVLVVSTTRQMAIIGTLGFKYDFPAELLALMSEGRIVAWHTGGEGEFSVEVVFATEPPDGARGGFLLSVFPADTGLVMPYSQFSYAADCAGGEVLDTPGLSFSFPLPGGECHVFLGLSSPAVEPRFRVTLTPAKHSLAAISDDLPIIPEGP